MINKAILKKINVDEIYKNIPDKIKQNGKGFVAGSWVAAQIFKQLNLSINPIANDIDWFVQQDKRNNENFFEEIYVGNLNKVTRCSRVFDKEFTSQNHYTSMNIITRSLYQIVSARQFDEEINLIVVDFFIKEQVFVKGRLQSLVDNFDFNAVQAGINVSTKELYLSNDFINFCNTLQLEIMNVWTPSHTMVRYLKKKRELGCYGDDEFNAKLCGAAISQDLNSKKFGQKMYEKAVAEKKALSKLGFKIKSFEIPLSSRRIITEKKEDELSKEDSIILYRLDYQHKEEIITSLYNFYGGELSYKETMKNIKNRRFNRALSIKYQNGVLAIPLVSPNSLWDIANFSFRYSKKQIEMAQDYFSKHANVLLHNHKDVFSGLKKREQYPFQAYTDNSVERSCLKFDLPILILNEKQKHFHMYDFLERFTKKHAKVIVEYANKLCNNIQDYQLVEKYIKYVVDNFGQVGIGILEASHGATSKDIGFFNTKDAPTYEELKECKYNRTEKYIKKQLVKYKKELSKKAFPDDVYQNCRVRDLVTQIELEKEGSEQSHCVGGYAGRVKSRDTKIISIESDNLPRITFELNKIKHNDTGEVYITIVQAKLKYNQNPQEHWRKKATKIISSLLGVEMAPSSFYKRQSNKEFSRIKF